MVYSSKKDTWLLALAAGSILIPLAVSFYNLFAAGSGAPAWSLDRLQVNYRRDGEECFVLISPADKLSFMRDLVSRGTGLEMRDERVIRASE